MFRSCTASLSSRTLARSSIPPSSRRRMALAMVARRHYSSSESKTDEGKEEPVKEEVVEEQVEAEAVSPELTKLQAKEEEVLDLTVRIRVLTSLID
jgi:molecular chaperone GrpE